MKYTPKTTPFKHQGQATVRALKHKNYALFLEPRLGKSKVALDYCGVLALKHQGLRVAILCPAIVQDVWDDQIKQHYPYWCKVEDRDTEWYYPGHPEGTRTQFFIMSHELFRKRSKKAGGSYDHPSVKMIEDFDPDVVIIDESHRLKRAGGVTAQGAWRMVRRLRHRRMTKSPHVDVPMPYVLLLTGTPNPKGWIDLFAQYRVMDDRVFGTAKAAFEDRYCKYGEGRTKYRIIRYLHKDEMIKKIHAHSFTCTAEQAGLAGVLSFQNLYVTLPFRARKLYNELAEEFITELESGTILEASNPGVKRLRLMQIAGGFTTQGEAIHEEGLHTLATYASLIEDQKSGPIVVYARFLPEVAACTDVLSSITSVGTITGATPRGERRELIAKLQANKLGALVLQVQAGSAGIELSYATECIFYSLPDGWELYHQNYNRLRGPNQKRPVRVTHLIVKGTVSRSVLTGLQTKEDYHQTLYRDPRRYLMGL